MGVVRRVCGGVMQSWTALMMVCGGMMQGWTAVMMAAHNGHVEVVRLLAANFNADVNAKRNDVSAPCAMKGFICGFATTRVGSFICRELAQCAAPRL